MDWNKIRTFYHIANAGSFSKAAESLNITQSALSRQIIDLELSVGRDLFFRRSRGLELTKHGELLYETATRVFTEVESGVSLLQEEDTVAKGLLKICTTPNIASLWAKTYLKEFMELYPDIRVAVIGVAQPDDYTLSRADVAITPYKTQSPDYIQKTLTQVHLKLYASPEYLKKHGEPKTLRELDDHKLISFGDHIHHPYTNIDWILTAGCEPGEIREPYMQINSINGMIELAEEGLGIITLSEENPALKESNLVPVLEHESGPTIDTNLIYPLQLKNSMRVKAFKEYIEKLHQKS